MSKKNDKIRILLIEDDEEDYLLTKDTIDEIPGNKYELVWASSYARGIKEIIKDGYAVYLVDYRLGKESGLDLLKEATVRERDNPFILLTGLNDIDLDIEAMEAGAADFLVKGQITPNSLDRSIRYAIKLGLALKKIKQSKAELAEAQAIAALGSWRWDRSENVISWSDEHYRIFGLKPQSEIITYARFLEFIVPEHRDTVKELFAHFLEGLANANFEYDIRLPDGTEKCVYVIARTEKDEQGEFLGITGISQDVTELRKANRELEGLNARLEEKVNIRTVNLRESEQKLREALNKEKELSELKSRFVSMASHEFRTPLSSILSSVSLIRRYNEKGILDKQDKHIHRIQSSVKNLTSILNDFLSLEKLESGKVELNQGNVAFIDFVEQIINELEPTLREGQAIKHSHTGSQTVYIDVHLVKNILFNLLSNAVKYSPGGDDITVNSKAENNKLSIDVIDNGIGIPYEDQKHMFSRFFRAGNVSNIKGTGLGLTIVKRYVNLMNGEIRFVSKPGEETCFSVAIPVP